MQINLANPNNNLSVTANTRAILIRIAILKLIFFARFIINSQGKKGSLQLINAIITNLN
jgi:hypothetical protein